MLCWHLGRDGSRSPKGSIACIDSSRRRYCLQPPIRALHCSSLVIKLELTRGVTWSRDWTDRLSEGGATELRGRSSQQIRISGHRGYLCGGHRVTACKGCAYTAALPLGWRR